VAPSELSSSAGPGDRAQFETLLADISAQLVAARADQIDAAITSALDAVRLFFEADRCALCTISDDREKVYFSHVAYAAGVSNLGGDLDLAILFPWVSRRIAVDRARVAVSRLDDLPPEAARDRASFESRGTRAMLCIPIQAGPVRLHAILVSVIHGEREWPEAYVPRLRLFGEMLVNVVERAAAEVRDRTHAARLAAAVDAAELGFAEWRSGEEAPYLDSQAGELLGIGVEEMEKALAIWGNRIEPGSRSAVEESRQRLLAGPHDRATVLYRYDHPRRGRIWLRHFSRRVEGEPGRGVRMSEAIQDVTERRKGYETLQALVQFERLLADVSARLIALAPREIDDAIQFALDGLRRYFRVDRCDLMVASDDKEAWHVIQGAYGEGVPHVEGDIPLRRLFPWLWRRIVVDRQSAVISRLDDLPPEAMPDHATLEAWGTTALLCVPIKARSSRLHVIQLGLVCGERDWPEEHAPRLRLFGERLVSALEGARAARRAQEEAARVAAAVDAAEVGFSVWVPGEHVPYLDSRLCNLLGIGDEEFAQALELWLARLDLENQSAVAETRRTIMAGETQRAEAEYRYNHPRRGWIWLRHCWRRVEDEADGVTRVVGAVQDITERRQTLEELRRLRDQLQQENVYLRQEDRSRLNPSTVTGRSRAVERVLHQAEQVAPTTSTVLLLGETGTGKERFASFVHSLSPRRDRVMIRVNCAAIPSTLIESELFGREKGAYTGALSKQIGRFELACGSTIFLDEIGELPGDIQVKLLRVLQERQIERLGSPRPVPIDVRIIAASNRDLERAVREGAFRRDLYYRLAVFPITLPPLRERLEDLPLLVQAFVDELSTTMGKRIEGVARQSLDALARYSWPGNVRELRNVVERALIMATGPTLRLDAPTSDTRQADSRTELADIERAHILQVLQDTAWRIRGAHGAAARLGLNPTTLESRIKKLGLARPGTESR
jgi:formate hydrogenlyase transcriptional activator